MSRTCTSDQWFRARANDPRIQEALERQRRVAEMHKAGASFAEIGRQLCVCRGRARILYAKALQHQARMTRERIERDRG